MINKLKETIKDYEENKPRTLGYIYMILSGVVGHFSFMLMKT